MSETIHLLGFGMDQCQIKNYIRKRLASASDFLKIDAGTITELPEHPPTKVALLQKAQSTSAAVEYAFSILKKLLKLGRNFKENVLIMMNNYAK